jgi:hypothetical protein
MLFDLKSCFLVVSVVILLLDFNLVNTSFFFYQRHYDAAESFPRNVKSATNFAYILYKLFDLKPFFCAVSVIILPLDFD